MVVWVIVIVMVMPFGKGRVDHFARSCRSEAGIGTRGLVREKGLPDVFQDFRVPLQGWRDCFAEFQESDCPVKESFELGRLHQMFAGGE
jgi:hypothetical protein